MIKTPVFGWVRDMPDPRDFTLNHDRTRKTLELYPTVKAHLAKKRQVADMPKSVSQADLKGDIDSLRGDYDWLPASVDLRAYCSPIEDQQALGSCTANAVAGAVECLQRRFFNNYIDASRLFLYKTMRMLNNVTGDRGGSIRHTMKALAMFGVAPEQYWPYDITKYDVEPSAYLYALASNYKSVSYYRLDSSTFTTQEQFAQILPNIKMQLYYGVPLAFGFIVFYSCPMPGSGKVDIPMPSTGEYPRGGHAVLCVGYDDTRIMPKTDGTTVQGAFLIRNSWGTGWGDCGYGWLPYDYLNKGLALDWWALLYQNYVDMTQFDGRR